MVRFALDAVTSFSRAPLRVATWMGFLVSAVALVAITYALVMRLFTNNWVTGWTALFIAVLFIGGAQLLALGIIGEYVGRIYGEAKGRPLYLIEETLGFEHAFERAAHGRDRVPERLPRRRHDDAPRRPRGEADTTIPVYHEPAAAHADESIV
jgi:dolichol-phosphate mannosyltransferase